MNPICLGNKRNEILTQKSLGSILIIFAFVFTREMSNIFLC